MVSLLTYGSFHRRRLRPLSCPERFCAVTHVIVIVSVISRHAEVPNFQRDPVDSLQADYQNNGDLMPIGQGEGASM